MGLYEVLACETERICCSVPINKGLEKLLYFKPTTPEKAVRSSSRGPQSHSRFTGRLKTTTRQSKGTRWRSKRC